MSLKIALACVAQLVGALSSKPKFAGLIPSWVCMRGN